MTRKTLVYLLFLGVVCPLTASADDILARFEGGIGSQPLRSGNPVGTLPRVNVVQGVNPGGTPWVISRLSARIKMDGRISVDGRGLLLGGGDNVGRIGGNGQNVHARLFCDGVAHNSGSVPLDADGDFRIDDVLVPLPPTVCGNATLLIVNAGGSWFAAGIPKERK